MIRIVLVFFQDYDLCCQSFESAKMLEMKAEVGGQDCLLYNGQRGAVFLLVQVLQDLVAVQVEDHQGLIQMMPFQRRR